MSISAFSVSPNADCTDKRPSPKPQALPLPTLSASATAVASWVRANKPLVWI